MILEVALAEIVAICLALIVLRAWRDHRTGINAELLVACAVTALVIPVVSYDYTLAILAGPVGLLLVDLSRRDTQQDHLIALGIASLVFCLAYSSTLFPLSLKPESLLLRSTLPALMVMLVADLYVALWLKPDSEGSPPR